MTESWGLDCSSMSGKGMPSTPLGHSQIYQQGGMAITSHPPGGQVRNGGVSREQISFVREA